MFFYLSTFPMNCNPVAYNLRTSCFITRKTIAVLLIIIMDRVGRDVIGTLAVSP